MDLQTRVYKFFTDHNGVRSSLNTAILVWQASYGYISPSITMNWMAIAQDYGYRYIGDIDIQNRFALGEYTMGDDVLGLTAETYLIFQGFADLPGLQFGELNPRLIDGFTVLALYENTSDSTAYLIIEAEDGPDQIEVTAGLETIRLTKLNVVNGMVSYSATGSWNFVDGEVYDVSLVPFDFIGIPLESGEFLLQGPDLYYDPPLFRNLEMGEFILDGNDLTAEEILPNEAALSSVTPYYIAKTTAELAELSSVNSYIIIRTP